MLEQTWPGIKLSDIGHPVEGFTSLGLMVPYSNFELKLQDWEKNYVIRKL